MFLPGKEVITQAHACRKLCRTSNPNARQQPSPTYKHQHLHGPQTKVSYLHWNYSEHRINTSLEMCRKIITTKVLIVKKTTTTKQSTTQSRTGQKAHPALLGKIHTTLNYEIGRVRIQHWVYEISPSCGLRCFCSTLSAPHSSTIHFVLSMSCG